MQREPLLLWEKILVIIGIAGLGIIFGWLFYENFLFTEGYDLLNLSSNDELMFHTVLKEQRNDLLAGRWAQFFSQTNAAYGNIFWSTLTLLTLPFYNVNPSVAIAIPKQVSLLAYIYCFALFFLICKKQKYSPVRSILIMYLIASSVAGLFTSTMLQSNTAVTALVLTSFYLLLTRPSLKFPWAAVIIYGLALGLKLTALFFLPVFLVLLNPPEISVILSGRIVGKNLAALAIAGVTALLTYCPAVLAYPFGITTADRSFEDIRFVLTANSQPHRQTLSFFVNMQRGFFEYHFHWLVLVLGAFCAVSLCRKRNEKSFPIAAAFFASLLAVAGFALTVKSDPLYVGLYSLPAIFLLPLVFLEFKRASRQMTLVVALIVVFNYFIHEKSFNDQLINVNDRYNSEETRRGRDLYKEMQPLMARIKSTDRFLVDCRAAFPAQAIVSDHAISYYYSQEDFPFNWKNIDVFVFRREAPGWTAACENIWNKEAAKDCPLIKRILSSGGSYTPLFSTEQIFVLRR